MFSNFDEPGSTFGDGQSTGLASGADTPLTAGTPGGPQKLKLTFSNPNAANGGDFDVDDE